MSAKPKPSWIQARIARKVLLSAYVYGSPKYSVSGNILRIAAQLQFNGLTPDDVDSADGYEAIAAISSAVSDKFAGTVTGSWLIVFDTAVHMLASGKVKRPKTAL